MTTENSNYSNHMTPREILEALAGVQRQQEGVRKAKSGLSGELMYWAAQFQCKDDAIYGRAITDQERAARAADLASEFAEYLRPVEDDWKKRHNAKLPGAWTQAKSDIKAAIKHELGVDEYTSFDELKKAKLAAAKAAKGETGEGEGDGASLGDTIAGVIETDSPVVAELLGQFSELVAQALEAGKSDEVIETLQDACIRLALVSADEEGNAAALTHAA